MMGFLGSNWQGASLNDVESVCGDCLFRKSGDGREQEGPAPNCNRLTDADLGIAGTEVGKSSTADSTWVSPVGTRFANDEFDEVATTGQRLGLGAFCPKGLGSPQAAPQDLFCVNFGQDGPCIQENHNEIRKRKEGAALPTFKSASHSPGGRCQRQFNRDGERRMNTLHRNQAQPGRRAAATVCAVLLAFAAPVPTSAQGASVPLAEFQVRLLEDIVGVGGDADDVQDEHSTSIERVMGWLARGGNPNVILDSKYRNTLMHHTAPAGQGADIMEEAVRRGGDCNVRNDLGATPLHFAASQGNLGSGPEMLRMLVRCEAPPHVQRTCAAEDRSGGDCRADPNVQDRRGNTPLHAIYEGVEGVGMGLGGSRLSGMRHDVQRVLLEELGADPNIRNRNGDTPLMLVVRNTMNSRLMLPSSHVSTMLEHGADPDTRNDRGDTPLIEAVSLGRSASGGNDEPERIVRLLLGHGADPNLRAANGDTPLIRAAKHGDDKLHEIRALLVGGADPCLRSRDGKMAHRHAEEVGAELSMAVLEKAGGYMSRVNSNEGFCVGGLRMAKEREELLALDWGARREFQSCLTSEGFDTGGADGIFGPMTRAAIRNWQASRGLRGNEAMGYISAVDADALLTACLSATESLAGSVFSDCGDCPDMIVIPAGEFYQGSPSSEPGHREIEGPQRRVSVQSFALGATEITFAQWDACVISGGCGHHPDDNGWSRGSRPVINVNWHDAQEYVDWLNGRVEGTPYRLPSESEWEYAARAGTGTPFPWGNDIGVNNANCANSYCGDGFDVTAPVGSFASNDFGLFDMQGNVWEWVEDCWNDNHSVASPDGSARRSGDCGAAVLRGGSWGSRSSSLRSACRYRDGRENRYNAVGFRVARTLPDS